MNYEEDTCGIVCTVVLRNGVCGQVSGYVYDSKRTTNERGTFSAMVIPSKWQGKDSWLIISMSTEWDDDL